MSSMFQIQPFDASYGPSQNQQNPQNQCTQQNTGFAQNLVMIEQDELLELMQAKKILDAQRQQAAVAQQAAFTSQQFVSPPTKQSSCEAQAQQNDSSLNTQEDSDSSKDNSKDNSRSGSASLFTSPFMFAFDNEYHNSNSEDQVDAVRNDFVDTTTQNHIQNSILNLIDDDDVSDNDNTLIDAIQNLNLNQQTALYQKPTVQAPGSTVNNITINNYGQESMYKAPQPFYPALSSMIQQTPSLGQAFELAQASQLNTGVTPFMPTAPSQAAPQKLGPNGEPILSVKQMNKKNRFDFPEGGWECSKCQNYNFKGRDSCYRCKKSKCENDSDGRPTHMTMDAQQKQSLKNAKSRKNQKKKAAQKAAKLEAKETETTPENVLGQAERVGNWACQNCFNTNFSFRGTCNFCNIPQCQSQQMAYNQHQNHFQMQQPVQQPQFYPNMQFQPQPEVQHNSKPMIPMEQFLSSQEYNSTIYNMQDQQQIGY